MFVKAICCLSLHWNTTHFVTLATYRKSGIIVVLEFDWYSRESILRRQQCAFVSLIVYGSGTVMNFNSNVHFGFPSRVWENGDLDQICIQAFAT